MTVTEIRAEINELNLQISKCQQRASEIRPAFLYDAEDKMSELDRKIDDAIGQKEMLICMLKGGVADG